MLGQWNLSLEYCITGGAEVQRLGDGVSVLLKRVTLGWGWAGACIQGRAALGRMT